MFLFGVTPGCIQGLLLVLCLGITPDGTQKSIGGAGIKTQVDSVQGKHLTHYAINLSQLDLLSFPLIFIYTFNFLT